jgi:guanylate kinase
MQNDNDFFSVVVSAPSGTGKTTLIRELLSRDENLVFVVSTTTRSQRDGEREGSNYYFVTDNEFQKKIQDEEFLEWALVHQKYYGTTKKEVDRIKQSGKIPIFDVDVQGAKQLRGKLRNAVYIFIIPPSIRELKRRLYARHSDSEEQIAIRIENALKELKQYGIYDYLVINDDVEKAVNDCASIIGAELCRMPRNSSKMRDILEEENDNSLEEIDRF